MKRSIAICLMLVTAIIAVSCGAPEIVPPKNYVVLEEPLIPYDFTAVSSDDCRIAITERDNENKGPLEFWANAFKNINVKNWGRKFIEEGKFSTQLGEPGKFMIFESKNNGIDFLYIAGIVRTDKIVYVIDAGGRKEIIEKEKDSIVNSFKTLK